MLFVFIDPPRVQRARLQRPRQVKIGGVGLEEPIVFLTGIPLFLFPVLEEPTKELVKFEIQRQVGLPTDDFFVLFRDLPRSFAKGFKLANQIVAILLFDTYSEQVGRKYVTGVDEHELLWKQVAN